VIDAIHQESLIPVALFNWSIVTSNEVLPKKG